MTISPKVYLSILAINEGYGKKPRDRYSEFLIHDSMKMYEADQ
jgi:hypothetical protein